jgi:ribosomal protein S18 acetylase RimI-like enzyme
MLHPIQSQDEEKFASLVTAFYQSKAALHLIEPEKIRRTLQLLAAGSPWLAGYLIESQGQIAGYVLLSFSYSNECGGMVLWIEELYVTPQFSGQGLGRATLKEIEKRYADHCVRLRLEVRADNENAIGLYRSEGYKELNYRQMVKDLPGGADRDISAAR